MTWEEYNEKVWDWSISTAASKISSIENFGDSTEVAEVISCFGFKDKKIAERLLKKALAAGLKFKGGDILEIKAACSPELFKEALDFSASAFDKADLEELYDFIEDELILDCAKKYHIPVPIELADKSEDASITIKKPISWKDFYDSYSFWDEEYCKKKACMLTDFGKSEDEIMEVLNSVFGNDEKGASDFVKKMLDRGLVFSAESLIDISTTCNDKIIKKAVLQSSERLDEDDLNDLYGFIEDDLIIEVANKRHIQPPEDLRIEVEEVSYSPTSYTVNTNKKRKKREPLFSLEERLALGLYPDDEVYKMSLISRILGKR